MRRSMHFLIVALLCPTLFVDTAKACWLWRHSCRPRQCRPVACEVVCQPHLPPACHGEGHPADPCGCGAAERPPVAPADVSGETVVAAGDAAVGGATEQAVVHGPTTVVGTPTPATEPRSVVAAGDEPASSAVTAQPIPRDPAQGPQQQEPLPTLVPAAATVSTASNEEPVPPAPTTGSADGDEPRENAATVPQPAAADVGHLAGAPVVPREPNLFDLYGDEIESLADEEARGDDDAPAENPGVPGEADETTAETGSADESPTTDREEAEAEPADEPAAEEAAEEEESAAVAVPGEPLRHWADATGTHRVQGWLVEMHQDQGRVRILKMNGRHTTVPIAALSDADQSYVTTVETRLAGGGTAAPTPATTETAGL